MRLFFRSRVRKFIAITLCLILMTEVFLPTAVYALTAGPTAPEATSFEPIDTTDMVNPLTGDFTYNMPLLEVPGPEGGYPLSLSYHAGIQPNEEASWVGLGWTLNPGAITRNVNGFPDDWYSTNNSRRDYWVGGTRTTYQVGITVGIPGHIASATTGLAFSQDTYQGFGVRSYGSIGRTIGDFQVGVKFDSQGAAFSAQHKSGLSLITDLKSASLAYQPEGSPLGMNISTDGNVGVTISQKNWSASINNSHSNFISTSSIGFNRDIPILPLLSLNLGYNKVRYWTDETEYVNVHGSLHLSGWTHNDTHAYDNYSLTDHPNKNIVDHSDPTKLQGGAFPDNDFYNVTGQGIMGAIKPYNFQARVLQQNIKTTDENNNEISQVKYFTPGTVNNNKPEFRFVNDFSNSYTQENTDSYSNINDLKNESPPFDSNPVYGNSDGDYGKGSGNKLAGSKHIKYFMSEANGNVNDNEFMIPTARGLDRTLHKISAKGHIAGFCITNTSGVNYHYNLPAYNYGEEIYQENVNSGPGERFNRQTKTDGYAYTWYLTTITGPDYVDRNGNNKADEGDWGYWVNFEYGKWSDKYVWRTPSEGFHKDQDFNFRNVILGTKEVYYLDAIRTRTHVAIFEKAKRLDAKSASPEVYTKVSGKQYEHQGLFNKNSSQSLRLDRVYLLKNEDVSLISASLGGVGNFTPPDRSVVCNTCDLDNNVIDTYDIDAANRAIIESKSIKIIDFKHSYDLVQGTINSFDINGDISKKSGKLTLTSVVFRGKGGQKLTPSTDFSYDQPFNEQRKAEGQLTSTNFRTASAVFEIGDLLETEDIMPVFCGVIVSKQYKTEDGTYLYQLRNGKVTGSSLKSVKTTKNPPYSKDLYDNWGLYKSDYTGIGSTENVTRLRTNRSSKSVDVWSLRRINTALGSNIEIDYESDNYDRPVLYSASHLLVKNVIPISNGVVKIEFDIDYNLQDILSTETKIDIKGILQHGWTPYDVYPYISGGKKYQKGWIFEDIRYSSDQLKIVSVYSDYIQVSSIPLYQKITTRKSSTNYGVYNLGYALAVYEAGLYNRQIIFDTDPLWRGGNIRLLENFITKGGGIRVTALSLEDNFQNQYKTKYSYSKGTTSYEPSGLSTTNVGSVDPTGPTETVAWWDKAKGNFLKDLYQDYHYLLMIAREVPPPGVMYERVTIENLVKRSDENSYRNIAGKTEYEYEVFKDNMIGREQSGHWDSGNNHVRYVNLNKFTSSIGALKRIINYDDKGNKISEEIKHFLHDGIGDYKHSDFKDKYLDRLSSQYNNQGLIMQRFSEVKDVRESDNTYHTKATMSGLVDIPAINTGSTFIDYVTGTRETNTNIAFDFYSGAVTQNLTTDTYGNRFLSETIPAYRKYGSMGLKISDSNNKHMLSQEAGNYIYKVDAQNQKLGLVSASVQTWGNDIPVLDEKDEVTTAGQNNIWRKKASYSWMPEGISLGNITPYTSFESFNYSATVNHASWKKTGEITKYNVYSSALEGTDINNNYATTRMGYKSSKAVLSGAPAKYDELAFSGAEDALLSNGKFSTGILPGEGTITGNASHTGEKSLLVASGKQGFSYQVPIVKLDKSRDYSMAVWVKPVSGEIGNVSLFYSIDGQPAVNNSPNFQKVAAGWYLIEMKVPNTILTGDNLIVGCKNSGSTNVYFDDFRFQPFNAMGTAYVYDSHTEELKYSLDNNNLYTKYEYDAVGRLTKTYKEILGKANIPLMHETVYNNGNLLKRNVKMEKVFRKTGCGSGYVGSEVTYTVPEGKHLAATVEAANLQAINDLNSNGQAYANNTGICEPVIYVKLVRVVQDAILLDGGESMDETLYEFRGDLIAYFYTDAAMTTPLDVTERNLKVTLQFDPRTEFYPPISNPFTIACEWTNEVLMSDVPLKLEHAVRNQDTGQFQVINVTNYQYYLLEKPDYIIIP